MQQDKTDKEKGNVKDKGSQKQASCCSGQTSQKGKKGVFLNGIWDNNPVFRMVLGMCPTLAVTTSLENSIGMGLATTFVLLGSNVIISSIRHTIPKKARIPIFITVISTFVTIAALFMRGFAPALYDRLGIYVPLIVVNCIIMARAESFASKNKVLNSALDGLGMGVGFTLGLVIIGSLREIVGSGKIVLLGTTLFDYGIGAKIFLLPAGAFLTIGLLLASFNMRRKG